MNRRVRPRADAPAAATPRRGPGIRERLASWRDLHLYSLFSSLGRLLRRPWATALTIAVMGLALALPLALLLALASLEPLAGSVRESREIALFLDTAVDEDRAAALATELAGREDVAAVRLQTPEEGLAEFRAMTEFAGALSVLDNNPLPTVLRVRPADDAAPGDLVAALDALPEADFVQHDAAWRERLSAWLAFGGRLALVVALLLGGGALLVVGNTVRLDIQGRAEEIATLRLLGATDGFVRRPFLYLGAWYGLGAGLLALAVVGVAWAALSAPLAALGESYGGLALAPVDLAVAPMTLAIGVTLGWLGAFAASSHHLHRADAALDQR